MTKRFHAIPLEKLPPRSWLFTIRKGDDNFLYHGASVDVFEDGFFEGCFAGDINEDFSQIANVFGSGLKIRENQHVFVTPSHTLESLFVFQSKENCSISNSLAFLVEYNDLRVPWDYDYGRSFASMVLGIDAYEKKLISTPIGTVYRYAYDNIIVDEHCHISAVCKPDINGFSDYTTYINFLKSILDKSFTNARHPKRKVICEPLGTCSSGYDSSACVALAQELGCNEALTLRSARGGEDDSGLKVGQAIGLKVTEFKSPELVGPFSDLGCFLATGMGGEDFCYRSFGPMLRRRILLTGFHGDRIWDLDIIPNPVLIRGDIGGCSLQEYRLETDFIHIPVPMIGFRHHQDVDSISRSEEMEGYRIYSDYDRPIPRKILEDKGVPRRLFAQSKKATTILFFSDPGTMSVELRREIAGRVKSGFIVPPNRLGYTALAMSWTVRRFLYRWLSRISRRIPMVTPLATWLVNDWRMFEHSHPRSVVFFLVGIELVRGNYRTAINTNVQPEL